MIKANFREWNLDRIDEAFGTNQVLQLPLLNQLLAFDYQLNSFEEESLRFLQKNYIELGGDDWNEAEVESKFITPIIVLSDISNRKFAYFLEREISATIANYELNGRVDGMIATGFRNPKKPYFCMNEYKKDSDPSGDPKAQALIEMLVAQAINDNKKPIFGLYITGAKWKFMLLEDKNYAFSPTFVADTADIFDIFRILKGLRYEIEKLITTN